MTVFTLVLKELTAILILASVVASMPRCPDCTLLKASETDTCSDLDPVICCGTGDSRGDKVRANPMPYSSLSLFIYMKFVYI